MSPMYRIDGKTKIDATKPSVGRVEEQIRFDKAMPINYDNVDLKDFLP